MKKKLEELIKDALKSLGVEADFVVEHPEDLKFGDYSTNVGIVTGKAKEIFNHLAVQPPSEIEKIELAGPGFINFYLSKDFFQKSLGEIIDKEEDFGKNDNLGGQKTIIEYTDPNPFKEFHIGHLMSNTIGEAVSRVVEWNGAEIKRACYQGDVGIHVAKAIWGVINGEKGNAYAVGAKAFEESEEAKREIQEINKKIYERSDEGINKLYDTGRKDSLAEFEKIYEKLGTKFDHFFFESETGQIGKKIVLDNHGKVFEKSDGAIVFRGEKYGLHTRVFVNSDGLPTYEAKELGLAQAKFAEYLYERSVVITGNEVSEYFKVVLEAMRQVSPELAEKTEHLSHGMLKLPTGKMSSRTGDVITAEELIEEVKKKTKGREDVAIGAIKYMILRQSIGNDIVFDIDKSVSTEGDSGVYLQYAHARACSVVATLDQLDSPRVVSLRGNEEVRPIEKLLYRFPEIVERACKEFAPNYITTYLIELASAFNNFYAKEQIITNTDKQGPYRENITRAFKIVMKNGLTVLGIPAPERV